MEKKKKSIDVSKPKKSKLKILASGDIHGDTGFWRHTWRYRPCRKAC